MLHGFCVTLFAEFEFHNMAVNGVSQNHVLCAHIVQGQWQIYKFHSAQTIVMVFSLRMGLLQNT